MLTTALILFLLLYAVSRLILKRSVATLSVEQKAMLVDASVSTRPWFFVALAALLFVWALASANFGHRDWLFVGFIIAILALSIPTVFLRLRRLSALPLPASYLRTVRLSSLLLMLGLLFFLAAMVYKTLTFVSA
jgi:hypothetical protein